MPEEIPKRIIVICFFVVASALFSIVSGIMVPQDYDQLQFISLPPILSWWTTKTGYYVGLIGNILSIGLAIMMVLGRNIARIIFNIYFLLNAFVVTVAQSYITPQVMAEQSPEMAAVATGSAFTIILLVIMTIYVGIFMWAVNSRKSRMFFQALPSQNSELVPDEKSVEEAQKARQQDQED